VTQSALLAVSAVILVFAAWINFEMTKRLVRALGDLSAIVMSMRSLPDKNDGGAEMRRPNEISAGEKLPSEDGK